MFVRLCMCDLIQLVGGNFEGQYVKSVRIRTGRSVDGFPLPPALNRAQRREVERIIVDALGGLSGDLSGKYYPLGKMTKEEETQLIAVSLFCALWFTWQLLWELVFDLTVALLRIKTMDTRKTI